MFCKWTGLWSRWQSGGASKRGWKISYGWTERDWIFRLCVVRWNFVMILLFGPVKGDWEAATRRHGFLKPRLSSPPPSSLLQWGTVNAGKPASLKAQFTFITTYVCCWSPARALPECLEWLQTIGNIYFYLSVSRFAGILFLCTFLPTCKIFTSIDAVRSARERGVCVYYRICIPQKVRGNACCLPWPYCKRVIFSKSACLYSSTDATLPKK